MFENFNEDDFLADLNQAIKEEEEKALDIDYQEEDNELIKNQAQANYFCKVVAELREEKNKKNELIDQEIQRIKNHYEQFRLKQNNEIDKKIEFLERCLKSFAIKELEGSKKKSIKLPYGTLSFKKQQDKYEYSEELIMDWLKNNSYTKYINTKTIESVDKKALKKESHVCNGYLFIDNNKVDGVTVTKQDDKFEIK